MSDIFREQIGDCFLATVISVGNTLCVAPYPIWHGVHLCNVILDDQCSVGDLVRVHYQNGQWHAEWYESGNNPPPPPPCVSVTGITPSLSAVVNSGGPGVTINTVVSPLNATNQSVLWSYVDGAASVSGNTISAHGTGLITIRATITNGLCGSDYTQDFVIMVGTDVIVCPAPCIYQPALNGEITCPYKVGQVCISGTSPPPCPAVPSLGATYVFPTGYQAANAWTTAGVQLYDSSTNMLIGTVPSQLAQPCTPATTTSNYYEFTENVTFVLNQNVPGFNNTQYTKNVTWRVPTQNQTYWQYTGQTNTYITVQQFDFHHIMNGLIPFTSVHRFKFMNAQKTQSVSVTASIQKNPMSRSYSIFISGNSTAITFEPDLLTNTMADEVDFVV